MQASRISLETTLRDQIVVAESEGGLLDDDGPLCAEPYHSRAMRGMRSAAVARFVAQYPDVQRRQVIAVPVLLSTDGASPDDRRSDSHEPVFAAPLIVASQHRRPRAFAFLPKSFASDSSSGADERRLKVYHDAVRWVLVDQIKTLRERPPEPVTIRGATMYPVYFLADIVGDQPAVSKVRIWRGQSNTHTNTHAHAFTLTHAFRGMCLSPTSLVVQLLGIRNTACRECYARFDSERGAIYPEFAGMQGAYERRSATWARSRYDALESGDAATRSKARKELDERGFIPVKVRSMWCCVRHYM